MKQKKNKGRTQIGSLATEDQGQMKMDRGTPWTKANVLMTRKRTLNTSIAFLRDTRTEYCKKKMVKTTIEQTGHFTKYKFGKRTNKWLIPPWSPLNVWSKPFVDQTRDFCFPCCSQFCRRHRLLVCIYLCHALFTEDDHLPLPSPPKKSSPPSNCLGAALALKPAWALAAHPAASLPSPTSDCTRALTMLLQVPSGTGLLFLCPAHVDELQILPASTERTGIWQNGRLSCARQSWKWWWSLPGAQGWGSKPSRYTRLKVSGRQEQQWLTGSKWSGPVASLKGCWPAQKAEPMTLTQALHGRGRR